MENELTHWKKLTNPNYLGSYSLQPGESRIVKITNVRREVVVGADGKKEECTVAYLLNEKPMILNSTNSKRIEKIAQSPYIEQWVNIEFMVYSEKIKAFGDIVDALRVKPIEITQNDLNNLYKSKKHLIKDAERIPNMERIINENEVKSFVQLHKYLKNLK